MYAWDTCVAEPLELSRTQQITAHGFINLLFNLHLDCMYNNSNEIKPCE